MARRADDKGDRKKSKDKGKTPPVEKKVVEGPPAITSPKHKGEKKKSNTTLTDSNSSVVHFDTRRSTDDTQSRHRSRTAGSSERDKPSDIPRSVSTGGDGFDGVFLDTLFSGGTLKGGGRNEQGPDWDELDDVTTSPREGKKSSLRRKTGTGILKK